MIEGASFVFIAAVSVYAYIPAEGILGILSALWTRRYHVIPP